MNRSEVKDHNMVHILKRFLSYHHLIRVTNWFSYNIVIKSSFKNNWKYQSMMVKQLKWQK